ncbi:uncharacterized protein UDID_11328 [Ustilago sp. UG-2017a]|nr:uncharacterized protein UDID_11328 [Ustilago sp. UG-2017a]
MTSSAEASKKRNSFSLLSRKDLGSKEPELANSRFIPESKRGWKYDLPSSSNTTSSGQRPKTAATSRKINDDWCGIVSTMKKPFATASKLLTKARQKSLTANATKPDSEPQPTKPAEAEGEVEAPERPHPVPLYVPNEGDAPDLSAQRSGFSYGLSLEDAVQIEFVISPQSSHQDLQASSPLDALPPPSTQQVSASKWREAMHSVWGFLPSFAFSTSSETPDTNLAMPSGNLLEAKAIPSVKKDPGNPDYFKNLSGKVVMLGGYRGSVLRDAGTNMMMWIPIKVGVGLRRPTLELGLSSAAEENSEELVYSSDMCTSIGKLVDMGKRFEERVAARRHAKVYAWGYDWRLSLARSSHTLITFLEELCEASSDSGDVPK